jgi:hypothetical protein
LSNNGTLANGTMGNETTPWNDTLGYLPFTPQLDAAYGVGGALLIITGIPVATLGGKNRWSALALISGYTVGVFCLVMVMSFGYVFSTVRGHSLNSAWSHQLHQWLTSTVLPPRCRDQAHTHRRQQCGACTCLQ